MSWAWGLALTLAGLLLVATALLAVPLELVLRIERRTGTRVSLVIGWLAGQIPHTLVDAPSPPAAPDEATPTAQEIDEAHEFDPDTLPGPSTDGHPEPSPLSEEPTSKRDALAPVIALVRTDGFLKHTLRTVLRLVRSFTIRSLRAQGRFGTGDPADTGRLFGRIQTVHPALYATDRVTVDIEPDFDRRVLVGEGAITLRVTPLRLAWVSMRYALSPTTLRAARNAWRARPDA